MNTMTTTNISNNYDVVVIGGGAAGLNGAVVLARARRSVAVIDSQRPRNAPAEGVHSFLTRDGINPAELLRIGRTEAEKYGARIIDATVTATAKTDDGFFVTLDDGTVIGARRILLASGITDELPDVPGLQERWGKDVVHCPYCHGWEVRDRAIGILGTGPMTVHQALMFRQWSPNITLFSHTAPQLTDTEREQLAARGITVIDSTVKGLAINDDALTGVITEDGTTHRIDALAVATTMHARADMMAGVGLEPTDHPMGIGTFIETDAKGQTAVPGVWAAGNVTDIMAQVIMSAAAGMQAGAVINADLLEEELKHDVAAYRARQTPSDDAASNDDAPINAEAINSDDAARDTEVAGR
jgi:thioredoxin reductase